MATSSLIAPGEVDRLCSCVKPKEIPPDGHGNNRKKASWSLGDIMLVNDLGPAPCPSRVEPVRSVCSSCGVSGRPGTLAGDGPISTLKIYFIYRKGSHTFAFVEQTHMGVVGSCATRYSLAMIGDKPS